MLELNKIYQGDCIEKLKELPDNSVDAIVTDPPYGLEFMGKEWDKFGKGKNIAGGTTGKDTPFGRSKPLTSYYQYGLSDKRDMQNFFFGWAIECLRILKPGGFLLAMGGTRTYHRLVCGIEDAGFEIRDQIMWLYGSGFPKSHNIGKAVDKLQGNERIPYERPDFVAKSNKTEQRDSQVPCGEKGKYTKGTSEWEGWGTALKPAHEPIVVARKPLSEKTVAKNVLKWGTGGINIDGCRVGTDIIKSCGGRKEVVTGDTRTGKALGMNAPHEPLNTTHQGRFPANIILDEEAGKMLDEQSGDVGGDKRKSKSTYDKGIWGNAKPVESNALYNDKGGASRFFYCPKASKSERNAGLSEVQELSKRPSGIAYNEHSGVHSEKKKGNFHPTVKPVKLMEYLVRLVTPKGGTVLDPFLGSGTTAIACVKEGMQYIGIEQEKDYCKIAEARLKPFMEQETLLSFDTKQEGGNGIPPTNKLVGILPKIL